MTDKTHSSDRSHQNAAHGRGVTIAEDYDVWLHWLVNDVCNLSCSYCNSDHRLKKYKPKALIDTKALIRTLRQTNKIFHISFSGGGEPFLVPNIIDACAALTERHYISLITNLTSKRIRKFSQTINPSRVKSVLASAHIDELERLGLLKTYIENFQLCRDSGFNITACEVAYPSFADKASRYRDLLGENGIDLTFDPFCGMYNGKNYPDAYTDQELHNFGLDAEKDLLKFQQHGNLCNAGYNTGLVWPDGTIHFCYQIKKEIGNIYQKIHFREQLIRCPFHFCACPLNFYDPYLFHKARQTTQKVNNPIFIAGQERIKNSIRQLRNKYFLFQRLFTL